MGFQHPGNTLSSNDLRELITAPETQTGVRPRRGVELVTEGIAQQEASAARWTCLAAQQQTQCNQLHATREQLIRP